jgi:hypothetical protein
MINEQGKVSQRLEQWVLGVPLGLGEGGGGGGGF